VAEYFLTEVIRRPFPLAKAEEADETYAADLGTAAIATRNMDAIETFIGGIAFT
jgi:hypothetical protein